ncbi:hypothetical protein AMJ39_04140 [candidate division TA06 bacterium DG_24]|uniref:Phosphoesterase n=3 Tax=Bacteria division TA06 TaxID=1156500 RepID=A0A0S8J9M2_UNCT6|nr:MAG: hypothetical protein AMJ39_04140 [candidate division TA06 bacterium DG_24]KPK70567.1 MAG: hypothetical protein AMJ82_02890 [candidate division TA06 bacterium SM23_40]KPL06436.1 MAG: hypothetical protein AMJ71_09725 [candidate division TA06 bacterium SM1_40]
MRIGVVSDSHGDVRLLRDAARELVEDHRVDVIIHLGDDYEDAEELFDRGAEVVRVPGVYSSYYRDSQIENRIVRQFDDIRILLTHSPESHENDLPGDPDPVILAQTGLVDVIAYGHTHLPRLEQEERVMWLNPGHLRRKDKKGAPASYALLDISGRIMNTRILELKTGREIASGRLERSGETE